MVAASEVVVDLFVPIGGRRWWERVIVVGIIALVWVRRGDMPLTFPFSKLTAPSHTRAGPLAPRHPPPHPHPTPSTTHLDPLGRLGPPAPSRLASTPPLASGAPHPRPATEAAQCRASPSWDARADVPSTGCAVTSGRGGESGRGDGVEHLGRCALLSAHVIRSARTDYRFR